MERTGKYKGSAIKIQVQKDAEPVIQPARRIPLHYKERLQREIQKMKDEDIIEGPIELEEHGTESRYSQVERESNGILTGMYMNNMYTLGSHIEVVTDHKPLIEIYTYPGRTKQLRIDQHHTNSYLSISM